MKITDNVRIIGLVRRVNDGMHVGYDLVADLEMKRFPMPFTMDGSPFLPFAFQLISRDVRLLLDDHGDVIGYLEAV